MAWNLKETSATWTSGRWRMFIDMQRPASGIEIHEFDVASAATPSTRADGSNTTKTVQSTPSQSTETLTSSPLTAITRGLLQIETLSDRQPTLGDCYGRLDDMIATYPEDPICQFGLQLDYRMLPAGNDHQLQCELWISLQTLLLESYPGVIVTPGWQAGDVEFLSSHAPSALSQQSQPLLGYVAGLNEQNYERPAILYGKLADAPWYGALLLHPKDQADWSVDVARDASNICRLRFRADFMEKGVIRRARCRWLVSNRPFERDELVQAYHAFIESPLPLTV